MPSIKLIIELTEQGKFNVTGPLQDDILCLGLLKKAEQQVIDFNKKMVDKMQGLSS